MTDQPDINEAELARLADGSLPDSRQAELRSQVQGSTELAAALAEQERAVSMLRALDQPAPARLRAQIEAMTGADGADESAPAARRARRRLARPRWRPAFVLPGATALAAVAAAIVVLVSGGTTAPTVPVATNLALAAATLPPPAVSHSQPAELKFGVDGIAFPNWESAGWNASGARADHVGGRQIKTVYYTAHGTRVGYAISSGSALAGARGATVDQYGVQFTMGRQGAARSITWLRDGHTCVVAARGVSYKALLTLVGKDSGEAVGSQAALHLSHSRIAYL
ncbi:MAG TPA: hypothetical protein VHX62_00820 [Solirubrobacteraceae bacterium]|nr:hypothetical protein [Solirubrobacteraceae bacterium]